MTLARWSSWRPADYCAEFYSSVQEDEQIAIAFQLERLSGKSFQRGLEYGCGPTVFRAIAASNYVASLDLADYIPQNLAAIRAWLDGRPEAHDWKSFTEFILRTEGMEFVSSGQLQAREDATRNAIARLLPTNARNRQPLGPEATGAYEVLISGFCLDCFSSSKSVWRQSLANVLSVVRPGGLVILTALERCKRYRVGDQWFPAANIDSSDLRQALTDLGSEQIEVRSQATPTHREQGYESILLASALKGPAA